MTDSTKKPALAHYDIKTQFNNLLYNSAMIIKNYDDLLLEIKDLIENSPQVHELIAAHYNKIADRHRRINGIRETFKHFDKIYKVEKILNSYYGAEQDVLNIIELAIKNSNDIK
ncbi:MAG: hypothetical protein FWE18_06100 [Alphaproteobacteria bacterium]|nr:hypothetical protein [Alphaproteobacteria bacterium]